jgi:uncharacterized membrane protein YgcG
MLLMRKVRRRRLIRLGAALLVPVSIAIVAACSRDTVDEPGELMVAVDSNVPLPGYIDSFLLQVVQNQVTIYASTFTVVAATPNEPQQTQLPGTLAVVNTGEAGKPVTVRLVGISTAGGVASAASLREVTTTVPSSSTNLLRLSLDALCFGETLTLPPGEQIDESLQTGLGSDAIGSCPGGQTCVAGGCVPAAIPALPPYVAGGAFTDAGTCFPVATCFDDAPEAEHGFETLVVDGTSCTVPVPMVLNADGTSAPAAQANLNVGVPLPSRECGSTTSCIAPLDSITATDVPPEGFYVDTTVSPPVIRLPPGLCTPTAGLARHTVVEVSTACSAKTVDHPLCGPGTRARAMEPESDGGETVSSSTGSSFFDGTLLPDGAVSTTGTGTGDDSGSGSDGGSGGSDSGSGSSSDGGGSGTDGGENTADSGLLPDGGCPVGMMLTLPDGAMQTCVAIPQ